MSSGPLRLFITKRLRKDPQLVEDIFQETMLAAYRGWHTFEHKSKYLTWLSRIALNKIADYYRKNIHYDSRRLVPFLDDINACLSIELTPEEEAAIVELRKHTYECLALLPDEYKHILELRYVKEYSYRRMAEVLNTSERSIEGKIYRAKKALRTIIEHKNPDIVWVKTS